MDENDICSKAGEAILISDKLQDKGMPRQIDVHFIMVEFSIHVPDEL
jgi:hypothetical protein